MKLHEYQAKKVFASYGVKVPEGRVVRKEEEVAEVLDGLGGKSFAVKAQILAGGRGKAGGVKLCRSREEVFEAVKSILGKRLRTHQTGERGVVVRTVLIERAISLKQELYLSMTIDRAAESPVILASAEGGVDIEELARERPEAVVKEYFSSAFGLPPFVGRKVAARLGLPKSVTRGFVGLLSALARIFFDKDASLVEMNPLALTEDDELVALDAKLSIDENALFRQKELAELRDSGEETPQETRAREVGISYVHIGGSVGCMVNGAGLAMATMDIIKSSGGEPANFLDVGGGATAEQVKEAFKILLSDSGVRSVLVNIYGGIARCDVIAEGIIEAAKSVEINLPVVIRLEGTNADIGRKMLDESGLMFRTAESMADAAKMAVEAAS